MPDAPKNRHASDSSVQQDAEAAVLEALRCRLNVALDSPPTIPCGSVQIGLDAFQDGDEPTCVEAWAHQGKSKAGQKRKLMSDMCKLLLAERLLGKKCRKIVAVCDREATAFLEKSWEGRFSGEFEIQVIVVDIDHAVRKSIREAQHKQYR